MALKVTLNLRCPKHPRFTPLDVEGNLKANPMVTCKQCWAIYDLMDVVKLYNTQWPEVKSNGK